LSMPVFARNDVRDEPDVGIENHEGLAWQRSAAKGPQRSRPNFEIGAAEIFDFR
jgi:hypothetical protein